MNAFVYNPQVEGETVRSSNDGRGGKCSLQAHSDSPDFECIIMWSPVRDQGSFVIDFVIFIKLQFVYTHSRQSAMPQTSKEELSPMPQNHIHAFHDIVLVWNHV